MIKIFPVDKGNDTEKLLHDIFGILNEYRIEKYPDTGIFGYGMRILKLFEEFAIDQYINADDADAVELVELRAENQRLKDLLKKAIEDKK